MKLHFILVEPSVPENIGFCARALKTMGFDSLRLVNPNEHLSSKALKTAYESHDILKSAPVYDTLKEAIKDVDIIIGTSAKQRNTRYEYLLPNEILTHLNLKRGAMKSAAILFGREDRGLSNEEIALCDWLTYVPMATVYPSLNLAQSVMVYAYELSGLNITTENKKEEGANEQLQSALKREFDEIAEWLNLKDKPILFQRMKDRLLLASAGDSELILSFIKALRQARKES
ncbi:MAG: tRNA/rRNA methyltransferase [Bacteroidota bacterium]